MPKSIRENPCGAATFELVINLNTAKALGVTLPSTVRAIAGHVIE